MLWCCDCSFIHPCWRWQLWPYKSRQIKREFREFREKANGYESHRLRPASSDRRRLWSMSLTASWLNGILSFSATPTSIFVGSLRIWILTEIELQNLRREKDFKKFIKNYLNIFSRLKFFGSSVCDLCRRKRSIRRRRSLSCVSTVCHTVGFIVG